MLKLRNNGVGPSELARKFGVDHSTIIYHAKRHGVVTSVNRGIMLSPDDTPIQKQKARVVVSGFTVSVRMADDGTPINTGKNYGEYLAERERIRWEQLLKGNQKNNNGTNKNQTDDSSGSPQSV